MRQAAPGEMNVERFHSLLSLARYVDYDFLNADREQKKENTITPVKCVHVWKHGELINRKLYELHVRIYFFR